MSLQNLYAWNDKIQKKVRAERKSGCSSCGGSFQKSTGCGSCNCGTSARKSVVGCGCSSCGPVNKSTGCGTFTKSTGCGCSSCNVYKNPGRSFCGEPLQKSTGCGCSSCNPAKRKKTGCSPCK